MSKLITATEFYKIVTKGDIYRAYRYIVSNNIELKVSIKYNIKLYDKLFPPKDFLRVVAEQKGYKIEETGFYEAAANKPFEGLGYEIVEKETKYWLYAPGTNADHWDEFYEANIMAIGWDALGDLTQYKSKDKIKENLVNAYGGEGSKKNDVTANFDFYHNINVGDVIIAKIGRSTLLGYGIVTSDYFFDDKRESYKSCRSIDWKLKGIWNCEHSLVLKTLTDITRYSSEKKNYKYYYEEIMSLMTNVKQEFVQWLIESPKSKYFGNEFEKLNKYLDICNAYFDKDIFMVSESNVEDIIQSIDIEAYQNLNSKFFEFSKKEGNHKPRAILGKKNYYVFLKEKFKKGMVKNKTEQIESLYQEYLNYLEFNDLSKTTINIYADNLKLILTKHKVKECFKIKDFEYFSNLKFKEYEKLSSTSFEHKGKGLKYFVAFFSDKLPVDHGHPLNQILYGPPGTGKTYNTINKAVSIVDPSFIIDDTSKEGRIALKERYDELVNQGQIVFTTFHQSMAYEDFVEGIKPETTDENQVIYKIEDGLFKKLSYQASYEFVKQSNSSQVKETYSFTQAYKQLLENIEIIFSNNKPVELIIKNGNKVIVENITDQGNIRLRHPNGKTLYTVSETRLLKLHQNIGELNELDNLHKEITNYIGGCNATVFWAVLNKVRDLMIQTNTTEPNITSYHDKKQMVNNFYSENYKDATAKPKVLIIDEINRGNVSAIFGELITLLEPSKRLGNKEALTVKLPYSKETFGVPNNLHIIGTMNTADRSVEALDTALRRRFVFQEMMPNTLLLKDKTIEDINLSELLEKINKRVEVLINRDHTIGHSYFINVTSIEELKTTFKDCIIPLLQEYFYGDDGKIGLILGEGFVKIVENDDTIFSSFEYQGRESLVSQSYEIIPFDQIDFKEAITKLLA